VISGFDGSISSNPLNFTGEGGGLAYWGDDGDSCGDAGVVRF